MNSIEQIFPLKGTVTWEILTSSNKMNTRGCVGANTLRAALGDFANGRIISWGDREGRVDNQEVTTVEDISMMTLEEPTEVTFIMLKPKANVEQIDNQDSK